VPYPKTQDGKNAVS